MKSRLFSILLVIFFGMSCMVQALDNNYTLQKCQDFDEHLMKETGDCSQNIYKQKSNCEKQIFYPYEEEYIDDIPFDTEEIVKSLKAKEKILKLKTENKSSEENLSLFEIITKLVTLIFEGFW